MGQKIQNTYANDADQPLLEGMVGGEPSGIIPLLGCEVARLGDIVVLVPGDTESLLAEGLDDLGIRRAVVLSRVGEARRGLQDRDVFAVVAGERTGIHWGRRVGKPGLYSM